MAARLSLPALIGLQSAIVVFATLNVVGTLGFVHAAARGVQAATSAA